MASETRKLRFLRPRGNPRGGAIIARGALIEIAEPSASRFIKDGTAVEAAEDPKPNAKQKAEAAATGAEPPAKKPAAKGKKKNG